MARREGYAFLDPPVRSRFLPQKRGQYFPERMILHWNYSSAIALAPRMRGLDCQIAQILRPLAPPLMINA
jgi:hypothetical protein